MRRILLVIDDFNELVGLETLFRRLGFDVLSLGRESQVVDAVLGFPPDLVIASGRGRHVNGLNLAGKLRVGSVQPRLVVLMPSRDGGDFSSDPDLLHADVDAIIETPFDPQNALKVVARLLSVPAQPLIDKFAKIINARLFEPEELKIIKHPTAPPKIIHVTGTAESAPPAKSVEKEIQDAAGLASEREKRYQRFLETQADEELPPILNFDRMREARERLEKSEKELSIEEEQRLAKHKREKREFVRAMLETAESLRPTEVARKIDPNKGSSGSSGTSGEEST